MEKTNNFSSVFSRMLKIVKSKVFRTLILIAIIGVSFLAMLMMDSGNWVRDAHFGFLNNNFIIKLFDSLGFKAFNVTMGAWLIFFCVLFTAIVFLISSIFSNAIVNLLLDKGSFPFKSEKRAKIFFTISYYLIVAIFCAAAVLIASFLGAFDDFGSASDNVFINLLLSVLICLVFSAVILVLVFVVWFIVELIIFGVKKLTAKNAEEPVSTIAEEPIEEVAITEEPEIKEEAVEETAIEEKESVFTGVALRRSFTTKLCLADQSVKDYYNQVKNHLLSYKKVNSRISFSFDSFNYGRPIIARFAIKGKTLVLYLALNPADYIDTKYYPRDVSDVKKYEKTPMMVKVKSGRGAKFAIELIDVILADAKKKDDYIDVDFASLMSPEVIEGVAITETLEDAISEVETEETVAFGAFNSTRVVKKSFSAKLCQSADAVKEYYSAIKNHLLSYKKVNSRVSFSYDSFNFGRPNIAKLALKGKTLVLYLSLNYEDYKDTKYFPKDASGVKKYENTPMYVKVKSERAVKFAKELIDIVLDGEPKKKDPIEISYVVPYKTDEQLLSEGLIKIIEKK